MTRMLQLELTICAQCPYCQESRTKGLGNGTYRCHKVYDDAPNFQGKYRRIGTDSPEYKNRFDGDSRFYQESIPDWCPLPTGNKG